jgi:hypothetical protein
MKLGIGMTIVGLALVLGGIVVASSAAASCWAGSCQAESVASMALLVGAFLLLTGYGRCAHWVWQSTAVLPRILVVLLGLLIAAVVLIVVSLTGVTRVALPATIDGLLGRW